MAERRLRQGGEMHRSGEPQKLRIVHISDLHLGKEQGGGGSPWRARRVLGDGWRQNLRDIAAEGVVDLVCFTGDIAQSGKPQQYTDASDFVEELLKELHVPKERFFCVPGNHDIDQDVQVEAWKRMREGARDRDPTAFARFMADGKRAPFGFDMAWRDGIMRRQAAYREWLRAMGFVRLLPDTRLHPYLGYRVSLELGRGQPIHVVGFDSAWLAGDDSDHGALRLTDEQVARLLTDEQGQRLPGWVIALVHHPLSDLADCAHAQQLLSHYGVDLLLHGHLHDPSLARWSTPAQSLHVSAAGCLYEDDRYPNGMQVLDIELLQGRRIRPHQLWLRKWSAGGYWCGDNDVYPGADNGKVRLPLDRGSGPSGTNSGIGNAAGQSAPFDAEALLQEQRERLLQPSHRPAESCAWQRRFVQLLNNRGNPNAGRIKEDATLGDLVAYIAGADTQCLASMFDPIVMACTETGVWAAPHASSEGVTDSWVTELICFVASRVLDLSYWQPIGKFGSPAEAREALLFDVESASALVAAVGLSHIVGLPVVWATQQEQGSVIDATSFIRESDPVASALCRLYEILDQAGKLDPPPPGTPLRANPEQSLHEGHVACLRDYFSQLMLRNELPVIFLRMPAYLDAGKQALVLTEIAEALSVRVVRGIPAASSSAGSPTRGAGVSAHELHLKLSRAFKSLRGIRSAPPRSPQA